jgi:hypothetical protein
MDKITAYLLSETHATGKHKCAFFKAFGFSPAGPDALAMALRAHPLKHAAAETKPTIYGMRYVVECSLQSPDGRNPCIVSVWQMNAEGLPGFVTAYPRVTGH